MKNHNPQFRSLAREAHRLALIELESTDDSRLVNAAIRLRMAIEALTYDRLFAYRKEIPESEFATWQPRKVMQVLLDIDPNADKTMRLSIREECSPGPSKSLGTDHPLDLRTIKKHYDALGSYLHIPTIAQLAAGNRADPSKLRGRCKKIANAVQDALESQVFNVTLGTFSEVECGACSNPIRRRLTPGQDELVVQCTECGAPYRLSREGDEILWHPLQQEIACHTPECKKRHFFWLHNIQPGFKWSCEECGEDFEIGLCVKPQGNREAAT